MSNFLTKKNPFLSLWLSGANRIAGTGRGLWHGAARRQQNAAIEQATQLIFGAWRNAALVPARAKRTKSRR